MTPRPAFLGAANEQIDHLEAILKSMPGIFHNQPRGFIVRNPDLKEDGGWGKFLHEDGSWGSVVRCKVFDTLDDAKKARSEAKPWWPPMEKKDD